MVAGPIKRYQDFQPKLQHPSRVSPVESESRRHPHPRGPREEICISDLLSSVTVNLNHHAIRTGRSSGSAFSLLAYGITIYVDFSAYSDIAIGCARLFGIRVPENFDWPYLRTNISTMDATTRCPPAIAQIE